VFDQGFYIRQRAIVQVVPEFRIRLRAPYVKRTV